MQQEKKYNDIAPKDKAPTFEEMVFLIEKNFKDYLEQSKAFTSEEIEQGWQRYKTINHLYQDATLHAGTAVWVKAHKGLIPDGIYNMKLISRDSVEMRGTGLVTNNAITLITFLNKSTMGESELPENYEGVYYLDETGQSNKDDAVAFHDWVIANEYEINNRAQMTHTTEQLYEQYKNRNNA